MFGAFVDEVEVERRAGGLGIKYGHLIISSPLFIYDITITSLDIDPLHKCLQYWNMYVTNGI